MNIRIIFKSFNKNLINSFFNEFQKIICNNCKILSKISLPIRNKKFCVLKSPHCDNDSREHLELRLYKKLLDITIEKNFLNKLISYTIPSGIYVEFQLTN